MDYTRSTWAYTQQFDPTAGNDVPRFAAATNVAARRHNELRTHAAPRTGSDPVEQLAKLSELHRRGVLTDIEFTAAKALPLGL